MLTLKEKEKCKPFPWKCLQCGAKSVVPATVAYDTELEHDGRTYSVSVRDLEAPRCEKCGEIVLDDAANRRISSAFREQLGLLTPEQIRGNREALGLTQRHLANLLGIAEATLSRWETGGQIQQRSLDKLLRLFFGLPEVRLALSEEASGGGLGSAVPVATTDTASPSDEELTEALKTAWNEAMASLRTSFQRRRQRALSRRWRDKESDISRCILPVVRWCLQADRRSLRHWIACFDRETSPLTRKRLDKHQPGNWLVIRLHSNKDEDTERATRISRLAAALDEVPQDKEEAAIEQFHRLLELMLPAAPGKR